MKRLISLTTAVLALAVMVIQGSAQIPPPHPTQKKAESKEKPKQEDQVTVTEQGLPKIQEMNLANVSRLVEVFRQQDPYKEYFTVDGKIHLQKSPEDRGWEMLGILHTIAGGNKYLGELFSKMPMLARRRLLQQATPVVFGYIVEYAHPDLIRAWITSLDWKRDVERVNPDLYRKAAWPEDMAAAIDLPDYGKVSKLDFWVRMFWLRRGEFVFNAVKNETAKKLAQKNQKKQ